MTKEIDYKKRKIKISPEVYLVFLKYIQKGFTSREAGGIIIGKENISNDNCVFLSVTEPYSKDIRKKYRFYRKDNKHIDIYKKMYADSNQRHRYIGEWHTHPEAIPNYSEIDRGNWNKIAKGSDEVKFYLHVIVGYEAFRIWQYNTNGEITLLYTFYWKEMRKNQTNM